MNQVTGIGIGLRWELAKALMERAPRSIQWLEVHPENYLHRGGAYRRLLDEAKERYPIVTHGLTMGFGSTTPFDRDYLRALRLFLKDLGTPFHSDHMCFPAVDAVFAHDLLPVPFNEESARTIEQRFNEARDALDVELAMENVSYYVESDRSETDEANFTVDVLRRADAKMLLDVNNVYVNSRNFGFDPRAWIDQIPADRVLQIHVAGHFVRDDGFRIDTHAEDVCEDVYSLLDYTLRRIGPVPVLLERDGNYPALDTLLAQTERLDEIYQGATKAFRETHESAPTRRTKTVPPRATSPASGAHAASGPHIAPDRRHTEENSRW